MNFFTSGLFWFIEGILFCVALGGLKVWTEDRGIPMPLWKWLLTAVWILYTGFAIAFIGTSIGENEQAAALRGGLIFGVVSIAAFVFLWRILGFGKKV